jgi:hypothetical protein
VLTQTQQSERMPVVGYLRVEPAWLRQLYVAEIKPYHYASVFEKARP